MKNRKNPSYENKNAMICQNNKESCVKAKNITEVLHLVATFNIFQSVTFLVGCSNPTLHRNVSTIFRSNWYTLDVLFKMYS